MFELCFETGVRTKNDQAEAILAAAAAPLSSSSFYFLEERKHLRDSDLSKVSQALRSSAMAFPEMS